MARLVRHVGIVGCSSEGAALCYRTLCLEGAARMGTHDHPEVSLHTHSLAEYMTAVRRDDWEEVARLMLSSAEKLASAGADLLLCPDNTIHQAFDLVAPRSPLPWLHIAHEVGVEARRRGFRRPGLLGTRWLMEGPVYPKRLQPLELQPILPAPAQREWINKVIFEELVQGRFSPESRAGMVAIIETLKKGGADAVILGCTEIPLLVGPEDSPLPVLDSTRLLARAALREALAS
ncbi:MAG TPA: amino acid racemase [Candidatus Polarisedimenticolia bacterium]|nr:amino acid racemase [Candidatus Polarisedimenticolia bacterium]